MFEIVLLRAAQAFLDTLDDQGKLAVFSILDRLSQNPSVDGVTKYHQLLQPIVASLYIDPSFKLVYVVADRRIEVWTIAYSDERLRLR